MKEEKSSKRRNKKIKIMIGIQTYFLKNLYFFTIEEKIDW